MNVSCKRGFWGNLVCTMAVVLTVFVFTGVNSELQAQQDAVGTFWSQSDFVDHDQAEPILAAFLANLDAQIAGLSERDPSYSKLVAQQNFVMHLWEDVSLGTPVATSLSNRYHMISEQASGTANTSTGKYDPNATVAQSFNPAYTEL